MPKDISDEIYKFTNEDRNNLEKMIKLVNEDYKHFQEASIHLKQEYDFCFAAVYSCLGKVNSNTNKAFAIKELTNFLFYVNKQSPKEFKAIITKKGTFSIETIEKDKPKQKQMRFPNRLI